MKHQPDANAIPPLVIEASRVSPPLESEARTEKVRTDLRRVRWGLRETAARIIPKERVSTCGIRTKGPTVDIRHGDGGAHIGGLHTCGSVWHCPVCAAKIAERRRQEVEELMAAAALATHRAYMAAFTFPHHKFQKAPDLRTVCAKAWSRVISGEPWKRACRKANFVGFVRAMEVTHGENGWHPHIHAVLVFAAGTPIQAIEEFGVWLFERWSAIIERMGYGTCNPEVWRWEPVRNAVQAGDYVVKWGADRELTQGHMKRAKGGGRTPWQLLEDAARGDKRAAALFREYAEAFKGARQLTFSKGFREIYGLREEVSDEEAATCDEVEERQPTIARLSRRTLHAVRKKRLLLRLLEAVEARPCWETVFLFLQRHGVSLDPDDGPPIRPEDIEPGWRGGVFVGRNGVEQEFSASRGAPGADGAFHRPS